MGTKFAFPRKSHLAHRLYILKRKIRASSEPNEPVSQICQNWAKIEPNEPNCQMAYGSFSYWPKNILHIGSIKLFILALWNYSYWLSEIIYIGSMKLFIMALWRYSYWLIVVFHIGAITSRILDNMSSKGFWSCSFLLKNIVHSGSMIFILAL